MAVLRDWPEIGAPHCEQPMRQRWLAPVVTMKSVFSSPQSGQVFEIDVVVDRTTLASAVSVVLTVTV